MTHPICINYGCDFQLDLDGQVTCIVCGSMNNDKKTGFGYDELKDFDMGYKDSPRSRITPFRGPIK
jgi:hypothetical protein